MEWNVEWNRMECNGFQTPPTVHNATSFPWKEGLFFSPSGTE